MDLLSILDGTPEPPIVDLHLKDINNSGLYNLPTPMFEFQKELTDQIVSLHYSDILKYCETNDTTELIIKSLEICVDNCMLVASHPYLLIEHYMPKNLNLRDIPAKLAETSGKFSVLKDLVNVIMHNSVLAAPRHIGIVMKNDNRVFDLIEALLLGCPGSKTVQRYVGNSIKKDTGKGRTSTKEQKSTFHLIPHDGQVTKSLTELRAAKFDAVIVMDGYVDTLSSFFSKLRRQNRRGDEAVMIRLIPINTIEHCLLHYENQKKDSTYLYMLISSIVCLRDKIGNLPPDIFPIYNQNLTYLSHTFFDHVFRRDLRSFPPWPLPELPKIPRFAATDVERSLLTEVVYHYTPYDNDTSETTKKKSYYETKRLQLDYVTNPLKNDYNTLSGIHNHDKVEHSNKDRSILTHKALLELNAGYMELAMVEEEHKAYVNFNKPQRQTLIGRRTEDIKKTLAQIMDDVDHVEQRIQVAEKKILKRQLDMAVLKEDTEKTKEKLTSFAKDHGIAENSVRATFIANQLKIWLLQNDVKSMVSKLQVKGDEKSYMAKEVTNCVDSVAQSEVQLREVEANTRELKRKTEATEELEEETNNAFAKQRKLLQQEIMQSQEQNDTLKAKLTKSLKFLKETSHLKKRKGRGVTPSVR